MVENVKTKKFLKFRWSGHMPHVRAEGSPRVRRSLGHVNRDTWGGCISNFKRIKQKMQFLHQFEYQIFKNLCFLKKTFLPLRIMNLECARIFCITKNISLLKKDFSRGWCFSIFDFGNFYAKPLFSMSLISMKNPKIVIFSWFFYLFSVIKSSCVTTFNAKYLFLYQIQIIQYLYFLNKAFFKFFA